MTCQFVDNYYLNHFGCYPFDTEEEYDKSKKTIEYLTEAGLKDSDIKNIISNIKGKDVIDSQDVLKNFKEIYVGSLIKPDTFYYHPELQLRSPDPVFNPETGETKEHKEYREMKIRYTIDDLYIYMKKKLKLQEELLDKKRDEGAINHLLTKYSKLKIVQPLDFVLFMIDEAYYSKKKIYSILSISDFEDIAFERLDRVIPEVNAKKANTIIWRS